MNYFKKKAQQIQKQRGGSEPQEVQGALGGGVGQGGFKATSDATGGTGASFAAQRQDENQMGQGFGQQTQSFSRTQQGDDPNRQIMRDDYGWKMTEAQYSALQKDKAAFDRNIKEYRKMYNQRISAAKAQGDKQIAGEQQRYNQWKQQFASQYQKSKSEFDKARSKLGNTPTKESLFNDWWEKRKMKVHVWDGQNKQGTYWIPRDMVNELHKELEGSYTGKGAYLLNVRQQGRIRGQEMHDLLRKDFNKGVTKNKFFQDERYQGAYRDKLKQWDSAKRELDKAQGIWQSAVARDRNALSQFNENLARSRAQLDREVKIAGIDRDKNVGQATNRRKGQVDAAREAYQIRAEARRRAYQNMAKMSGTAKPRAPQGQQAPPQTNNQGEQ